MSILFGVLTASAPVLFIALMVIMGALKLKTGAKLAGAYVLIALFYSTQTYAPRNTVVTQTMPYQPEREAVEESPPIFSKGETRVGQFDERIKEGEK